MAKISNDDCDKLIKIYGALYYDDLGKLPPISNMLRFRKAFNTILEKYTVVQLFVMVFCHFEWRGHTGEMESSYSSLRIHAFPIDWLPGNADQYAAYCLWVLGKDVWENKDGKLTEIVSFWTKRLFEKIK